MSRTVLIVLAAAAFAQPAHAFQNGQHQNISQAAIDNAAKVAPDIQKFGTLINSWSWGIGTSANLTKVETIETLFTIKGNPAEELAHLEDQQKQIDETGSVDGGNYDDILNNKIQSAFRSSNFSNATPSSEGAYIWIGAALHLIEDQASPPHGANIIHGVGDQFEGPLLKNGQKIKPFTFTSNTASSVALSDLYANCLTTTQRKIPNFNDFSRSPAARLWLLNSELSGFGIDGTNGFGRYGGVILLPPLSDATDYTKSAPADIYQEPDGPSIFTDQSTQAGDFGTNFLIQISKSLPPIISELNIAGIPGGGDAAEIDVKTGSPIFFRLSENRSQAVSVTAYVQDTNQSIITGAATLTLSSARSADGTFQSSTLPGPMTWSNNRTPLFETLNDGSVFAQTLLPFDSNVIFNWDGRVVGTPLANGAHTLCFTATPSPSDSNSNPSQPVCGPFQIERVAPAITAGDAFFYQDFSGIVDPQDAPSFLPAFDSNFTYSVAGQSEIQTLSVVGPNGPIDASAQYSADRMSVSGTFKAPDPGAYSITAIDAAGNRTMAPFVGATITTTLNNDSSSRYDPQTGSWTYSLGYDINASQGVNVVNQLQNGSVVGSQSTDHPVLAISTPSRAPPPITAEVIDDDGNFLSFGVGSIIVPSGSMNTITPCSDQPTLQSCHQSFADPPPGGTLNGTILPVYTFGGFFDPSSISTGLASGSFTSPVFDTLAYSVLPGAILRFGTFTDPVSQVTTTYPAFSFLRGIGTNLVSGSSLPPGTQDLATLSVSVVTGNKPDLSDGVATQIVSGNYPSGFPNGNIPTQPIALTVGRYYKWIASVTSLVPPNTIARCVQSDPSNPDNCLQGNPLVPVMAAVEGNLYGLTFTPYSRPALDYAFQPGTNQSEDIANGVSISGLNVNAPCTIEVSIGSHPPEPGYKAVPNNVVYNMNANPASCIGGPANVNLDLHTAQLTPDQLRSLRVVTIDPGSLSPPLAANVSGATATVSLDLSQGPLTVMAIAPTAAHPVVLQKDGFTLSLDGSQDPALTMQAADPQMEPLKTLLAQAAAVGLRPLGPIEAVSPTGVALSTHASLIAPFTPQQNVGVAGVYQLAQNAAPQRLPGQYSLYLYNVRSAQVPQITGGYFAVFGYFPPVQIPDTAPPVTALSFSPSVAADAAGRFPISSTTAVILTASDPTAPNTITSGVATTYFLLDSVFISTSATPVTVYSAPFNVSLGSHSLTYFSADNAGNFEFAHIAGLDVAAPPVQVVPGTAPPRNLTAVDVASTTVELSWDPNGNSDATQYIVFYGTVADAGTCAGGVSGQLPQTATTTLTAAGLQAGTAYQFFACTVGGDGACGDAIQVVTAPSGQGSPDTFTVYSCGGNGSGGGGGSGPERGLAIASDAQGRLWEVVNDGGVLGIVRFTNGVQDTGVELPYATDNDGAWTIRFDRSGSAYAIGTAQPPNAQYKDVAVYKVSQDLATVTPAYFHAGDAAQAVAFDANGDLWITGFVQTGGGAQLQMGLWKYSLATGQVAQTASFSPNVPTSAGFGVRALDGAVFVEGYTSTQTIDAGSLDLALWKFDALGHGPVAGPFTRPGYLTNVSGAVGTRLEASSGTLYAATMRTNAQGQNDLGFLRYDANGAVLLERYESLSGFGLVPSAIGLDASGNVAVAVSAFGTGSDKGYGLARFARDGSFLGMAADSKSQGAVNGMAAQGSDLWLAVDGATAPVRFTGDMPLTLSDVLVSSAAVDGGAPVTTLRADGRTLFELGVAASTSVLTFSALDPPDAAGVSEGVAETLYWIDVPDPFSCDADYDPAQPAGTCANPVFSLPFSLSIGTHTVAFQSTDAAGNSEELQLLHVAVAPPQYPASLVSVLPLSAPAGGLAVTELANWIYVSEPSLGQVLRLSRDGRVQASWGGFGAAGPGALGGSDSEGVYALDPGNQRVLRFDPRGNVIQSVTGPFQSMVAVAEDTSAFLATVVDETGNAQFAVDSRARLTGPFGGYGRPRGIAVDGDEDVFLVDALGKQVIVGQADGTNRVYGAGTLRDPDQIAVAPDGRSFVSDRADHGLHVFDAQGAPLGVVGGAGLGTLDFAAVKGLGVDSAGQLYVADGARLVTLQITAPSGPAPALSALTLDAVSPWAADFSLPSPAAALYDLRMARTPISGDLDFAAAQPVPVPGLPSQPGETDALRVPGLSPGGTYYVALKAYDAAGRASNMVTASFVTGTSVTKGSLVTVAGNERFWWLGDGWPATSAGFASPRGVARDAAGNLYITDAIRLFPEHISRLRKVDAATGVMTTIAGGRFGFSGDGGPALQAAFGNLRGVAVDTQGNIYLADTENNRIRRIDGNGIVTTVAGTGVAGYSGDGGPATSAQLNSPRFIVVDASGNPVFADSANNRVRKIDVKTGVITTLAGNGQAGSGGDGGPATQASLNFDIDVALSMDAAGDLYISEIAGCRLRKVDGKTGVITRIAGDGTDASTGDGGLATSAQVSAPAGIAVDPVGNVYFAEVNGNKVRRIDARTGIITTVAGDGAAGSFGEDGPGAQAELYGPSDLFLDAPRGLLYIADGGNDRVAALGIDPFVSSQSTATVGGQPEAVAASTAPFTVTQVSSATQAGALLVSSAAAAGLSPVGDIFVISPAAAPGAPVQLSFTFDPVGVDTSAVAIYHFDGVSWSSTVVLNQSVAILPSGLCQITGEALLTSPFGVFRYNPDRTPPVTTLLVDGQPAASGQALVTTDVLSLAATDNLSGVAAGYVSLDGAPAFLYRSTFTLAAGSRSVSFYSVDRAGNAEAPKTLSFVVVSTFSAALALSPDTLNLKSQGQSVEADLSVFGSMGPADVDQASARVTAVDDAAVSPLAPTAFSISGAVLQMKLDRAALIGLLTPQQQSKVTLSGRFKDGLRWSASALIRTINPSTVKPNQAASVVHPTLGAVVALPAGAVTQALDVTLTSVASVPDDEKDKKAQAASSLSLVPSGKAFDFGPEGTRFSLPVTLTVPYDPAALGAADPAKLTIAYWNAANAAWEPLASRVDQTQHVVIAQTSHFSQYQVLAPPPPVIGPAGGAGAGPAPAAAADAFRLVDLYAFPNPARRARPTIRAQFGLADSVDLRIYDLSGALLRSATLSSPAVLDDGNGKGPQWTFDYVWDAAGAGSGVYLYVATAHKGGAADIRKSGKVAVIK